jgi:hypothetical protein
MIGWQNLGLPFHKTLVYKHFWWPVHSQQGKRKGKKIDALQVSWTRWTLLVIDGIKFTSFWKFMDFSFFLFYIINSLSSISTWLSILPGPHLPLYREGLLFNSKKRKPIIWCNHTNWLKSIKYNHLAVTNTTSIFQHFCLVSWTGWSVDLAKDIPRVACPFERVLSSGLLS